MADVDYWDSRWTNQSETIVDVDRVAPQIKALWLVGRSVFRDLALSGDIVVDLGGGTGKVPRFFGLHEQNNLHICDLSGEAARIASQSGLIGHQVDVETDSLPFGDGTVTAVLCQEIIEHLNRPGNMLDEAHRVLRPEGWLYLTTPNLTALGDRIRIALGRRPLSMDWDPTHIRFYRHTDIETLLANHGFAIKRCLTSGVFVQIPRRGYIQIAQGRRAPTLGQHVIMLAQKSSQALNC